MLWKSACVQKENPGNSCVDMWAGNIDYGLFEPDGNLRSSEGGSVAAQKKSKKKAPSASAGRRLTQKQYEANFKGVGATFSNALKSVERLELDLKRIKSK